MQGKAVKPFPLPFIVYYEVSVEGEMEDHAKEGQLCCLPGLPPACPLTAAFRYEVRWERFLLSLSCAAREVPKPPRLPARWMRDAAPCSPP